MQAIVILLIFYLRLFFPGNSIVRSLDIPAELLALKVGSHWLKYVKAVGEIYGRRPSEAGLDLHLSSGIESSCLTLGLNDIDL